MNALARDFETAGGGCCVVPAASPAPLPADEAACDPAAFVRPGPDGAARLDLLVEGMSWGACIGRVEQALSALPGVRSARVDFQGRRVAIGFDAGRVDPPALTEALAAAGYRSVPFDPDLLRGLEDRESRQLLQALAVAGFAAANVMLLSVSVWAGAWSADMGPGTRDFLHWLSALIALPAVAYAGRPFFASARRALAAGRFNMDVPISLAVLLALAMSLHELAVGGPHAYFDASVTLLFFLLIGRFLDRRARGRAAEAAGRLMLLGAMAATVIGPDGRRRSLPVGQVRPGDRVFVAAGERVPVDGRVLRGAGAVDCALVTGESRPVAVAPGHPVHAGTVNLTSPLEVRVEAAGEGTLLAEIVRLVEAGAQGRARYVRLADRLARIYAPAVHVLAASAFLGWLLLAGAAWQQALLVAVAVLIVTCPCALGLAVPAVQVVATGRLLRAGVLVKAADGLERLADVDTVVLDKTGTVTLGRPELAGAAGIDPADLALAGALACASRHPLARALARAADVHVPLDGVREEAGCGLAAPWAGGEARLGSRSWCGLPAGDDAAAGSEIWLDRPGAAPVRFGFDDVLREDARALVDGLKARGLAVELVSGDREPAVRAAAAALGIADWRAGCRPADKARRLDELAAAGRRVAMVGDGINDAPALARAHASLSPAGAADVSRTAADMALRGEALSGVLAAFDVARQARRLVLQNFALALGYNAIAVPLAMAGQVTPFVAAVVMSASSLVVTLNALRLRGRAAPEAS